MEYSTTLLRTTEVTSREDPALRFGRCKKQCEAMSHLIVLVVVNTKNQVSLDSHGVSVSNLKIQ